MRGPEGVKSFCKGGPEGGRPTRKDLLGYALKVIWHAPSAVRGRVKV